MQGPGTGARGPAGAGARGPAGAGAQGPARGTCRSMCPAPELRMRERERLLHRLEAARPGPGAGAGAPRADPRRTVKCYSRSAADVTMSLPHLLRPFDVLLDTVHYLLLEAASSNEVSTLSVYNFVSDRLRAVRQDMTIQALPPDQSAVLLEPMIRFHVLYGYKLCELTLGDYDPVLNKNQLLECLKLILVCFDAIENSKKSNELEELSKLCKEKLKLDSEDDKKTKSLAACDRQLMETMYIVCNLDDIHPLMRYWKLPKEFRKGSVQLAYNIAIENMRGNYVRACRLATQLCSLSLCMFAVHLPLIQRRAVEVMSHAYNNKQLTFPSKILSECLLFNSSYETCEVCLHYGLKCTDGNILFNKTDYRKDARLLQPKKLLFIREPNSPFTTE